LNPKEKIAMTFDYLFGKGVSTVLPLDRLEVSYSKRTGKIKTVNLDGRLLATFRSDGGVALTINGAEMLIRHPAFIQNCIVVERGVDELIASGRSVFAKHVTRCGDRIRPGAEVAVLDEDGRVIAVGKAILSAKMMRSFKVGVAVKVREGVKQRKM